MSSERSGPGRLWVTWTGSVRMRGFLPCLRFSTYLGLKPILGFQLIFAWNQSFCLQSIFFLGAVPGMLFFGWFWWVFNLQVIVKEIFTQWSLRAAADHHNRQLDCSGHRCCHTLCHWAYLLLRPEVRSKNLILISNSFHISLKFYWTSLLISGFSWVFLSTPSSLCHTLLVRVFQSSDILKCIHATKKLPKGITIS